MSEIIAATASQVLEGVAAAEGQAATETVTEWLARAQFEKVVSEGNPNAPVYRWNYSAADAFDKVVEESNAQQAYENWLNSGGNQSPTGSATQPPVKSANPQTAIKKAGAGTATAGGLLSMSLPTWVAAAAPLLGVAVGVGLYELSPEFWEKVSRKLLPFCYDDAQSMPVVTDEDGNTYIDKGAVEALKELFEEEGIGPGSNGTATLPSTGETCDYSIGCTYTATVDNLPVTYIFDSGYWFISSNGDLVCVDDGSAVGGRIYGQRISSTGVVTQTWQNVNSHSTSSGAVSYGNVTTFTSASAPSDAVGDIKGAEIITYGNREQHGGAYPEGTSQWTGQTVDIGTLPVTQVYTDPSDGTKTRDYIPVALPIEPGQSLDPEENPDPTQNENPEEQIDPYIMPTIPDEQYPEGSESEGEGGQELDKNAPIPIPVPNPDNETDPQANPTEEPEQPPQKLVDLIPPIDTGNIPFPNMPGIGDPSNVDGGVGGLVSVYNPTYAELQAFAQWLWVTYADATIDKIWNNPFDGVISLHELYATPNKGARKNIKSGFLVSPVSSITIPNRYSEINCGTAIFPEYWGNYLDYSPYSKALCYLPFIGIVELNVDDIVGHAVNIKYRVDSYSGAVIALLTCAKTGSNAVLYQFSGNCSVQMPIAGGTQAAIKAAQISAGAYQNAYHIAGLSGLVGGMLGGLGSLLTGNIGGAISQAVGGVGSYATNQAFGQANYTSQTVGAKSSVQHSGQFGESFGAMGAKKPYMIIKRPVQVVVQNYQDEYGYQAHKYVTIGECEGYLRCRGVHVQSARATDSEKHAIEQMLMEGVYVTE